MLDTDLQQKRLIAAAIDFGIAVAIAIAFGIVGMVVGLGTGAAWRVSDSALVGGVATFLPRLVRFVAAVVILGYVLGRDVFAGGRSLGKRLQDIRLMTLSGQPVTFIDSARRNAIFGVGSLLGLVSATLRLIPCLGDFAACLLMPILFLGALVGLVAVVVEVLNEGEGFPPAALPHLFDKFTRGVEGDGRPPGTGLGLAIARGFLEAQGASIEAANRADKPGAIVRMTFPIEDRTP